MSDWWLSRKSSATVWWLMIDIWLTHTHTHTVSPCNTHVHNTHTHAHTQKHTHTHIHTCVLCFFCGLWKVFFLSYIHTFIQLYIKFRAHIYMCRLYDFLQAWCEHLICQIPWLHSVYLCSETLWPVQGQKKMWRDTSSIVPPSPSKPAMCGRLRILSTAS